MPKDRDARRRREAAARRRRSENARPPRPAPELPVTEASVLLAADLEAAGLTAVAARARRLEFDDNYSPYPDPMRQLIVAVLAAGGDAVQGLIERVKTGVYDATEADIAAFGATERGRAEHAEIERLLAANPQMKADLDAMLERAAADPKRAEQMMNAEIAALAEQVAPTGPLPDDDRVVDPSEVNEALAPIFAMSGPNGERLATPTVLAGAELVGRTGGRQMELGWLHDGVPAEKAGWYAHAVWNGARMGVEDQPGPNAAMDALAQRLLTGGQCQHCGRITSVDPSGVDGGDRVLVDGRRFTLVQQQAGGVCVWTRQGLHWVMGCAEQPR